jgi:hypothetical protein
VKTECDNYSNQIPKALLGDLSSSELQAVESHCKECSPCARERDLYAETLHQLGAMTDVAAPRHFFVYPKEHRPNPWQLFQQMAFPLKTAIIAALLAIGIFTGAAAAKLEIRSEPGRLTFSFGNLPAPIRSERPVDPELLKAEILQAVERNQQEKDLELARTLRAELAAVKSGIPQRQRLVIERALADFEKRTDSSILNAATALQASTENSIARMYRIIQAQQQQELAALNERVNKIAVSGEIKSNQTDVILETLLQVAENRIK